MTVLSVGTIGHSVEVQWTRFKGTVKAINYKLSTMTIENRDGDLFGIRIDPDVTIREGREEVPLGKVKIDDKVTLFYAPRATEVVGPQDTPDSNGILPPSRR